MAQSDFAEKIEVDGLEIEYTDVMTGDKNKNRFLYYQLKMSMQKANKIDSNFIMMCQPYIGLFADGAEQWCKKVGFKAPSFSTEEEITHAANPVDTNAIDMNKSPALYSTSLPNINLSICGSIKYSKPSSAPSLIA